MNKQSNHSYDYDLIVIGAGSGGVRAARISGTWGAKVAVIEKAALGGTCVNVGCIPKKLFVYSSHFGHDFEDSKAYGWDVEVKNFHWKRLVENKDKVNIIPRPFLVGE
jgi:glutathione reductase (NADPH)